MKMRFVLTALFLVSSLSMHLGAAVPNAPSSLNVVVDSNTVTLTWSAPTTGDAPASYLIRASLSPGGPLIAQFSTTNTTEVITSVPEGVYYVHVVALNAEGAGAASNEVVVSVPGGAACTSPPTTPTGFTAAVAGSQVTLSWTAPTGDCAATGYVIQAGSGPGLSDVALLNVGNMTSLAVTAPAGTYYVRLIALNASGSSAASSEVVVTVGP